jgi:transcriptional regulator with XRE-family HTH domain
VSGLRTNLWKMLRNKLFRHEYVAETVRSGLAHQIRAMRNARGMSQLELAEATGKTQSNIARLEDPDYGNFTLKTLLEIGKAFDVWLSVEFISFSKGLHRTEDRSPRALNAVSFQQDWEGREGFTATGVASTVTLWMSHPKIGQDAPFGGVMILNKLQSDTQSMQQVPMSYPQLTASPDLVPPIKMARTKANRPLIYEVN